MAVILGGNTGIYLASLTPPAPQLLLDTYPNADVAYSLRKLRTAYAGSAIRVRRSVDNAEQDIAFVANELDTTTMLNFVGYNLLTYSEDITQQLVGGGRATYTNNVEVSPDSNLTGGKFATDGTFGEHYLFRNAITILNSTYYNISVYLKQAEFTKVRVSSNISGAAQNCDVDLTNGAISNNGFVNTPVVTAEANGWYRFSVTITSGTTSASPISIRLYNTSGAISFVGDAGKGIYVWGYQLSQTSTVKTYQKTVATAGGNGFVTTWYDQSGNSLNSSMSTAANQPRIVNAGVLDVKNSKAGFRFDGSNDYLTRTALSALNSGNTYSIFSVAANEDTGIFKDVLNTTTANNFRLTLAVDTRTTGGVYRIGSVTNTSNTIYAIDLAAADGSANQRLQTMVVDGFNMAGWKNGVAGSTNTYTGTYNNQILTIGSFVLSSRYLNGYIQELIIYASNQTTNRTAIESNINSYYTIY